jgi:hypothetical protein
MKSFLLNKRPRWVDVFWLLSGAVVAAWLAPHSAKWFASNFFYYWAPHLAVLILLWVLGASRQLINGAAVALATYLALFGA